MLGLLGWLSAPDRSDTEETKLAKRCKAIAAVTLAGDRFQLDRWWQAPDLKAALHAQNQEAAVAGSDAAWLANPSEFDLIPQDTEGGGRDGGRPWSSHLEIKRWVLGEQRAGRPGNLVVVHRSSSKHEHERGGEASGGGGDPAAQDDQPLMACQ
jgi:hypothetical protein